jgi:gamma-butyrobetaine dioxygenase
VLHGRTSFDPSEGHRQLQGCYVDRDGPRSRYLVLKRQFGEYPYPKDLKKWIP